jgi:hypothetical protein
MTKVSPKPKTNSAKLVYLTLIATGAVALTVSIIYTSSVLSIIGLGLIFWGIIFTYIRTEEYTKKALLDAIASSELTTLNQIIKELDYEGDAIYLPPKYLKDTEDYKVYVPKQKETRLPTPDETRTQEQQIFMKNSSGLLLTPPGAELTKLFEKTLDTNFTRVDLKYLQQKMPKLFIDDLEIAQNFEIETENNRIHVKIQNSQFKTLSSQTNQSSNTHCTLGSSLSSAIACAIAKTAGKAVIVEKEQTSEDGIDTTIAYRILEEEE